MHILGKLPILAISQNLNMTLAISRNLNMTLAISQNLNIKGEEKRGRGGRGVGGSEFEFNNYPKS